MTEKERLDIILVNRGLIKSRELAKAVIMSGCVYVNGQKEEKAGHKICINSDITVKSNTLKYVSRGGLKLEKALTDFDINITGKNCIDIGASTGGFTDCMLQNGANAVTCVDVGYGQLDWRLRNDERVTVLEKTNARYLTLEKLNLSGDPFDFATVDVSFISLTKIVPVFEHVLAENGEAVCLIKPQFECGKKYVGKKGVVKDASVHEYVIEKVVKAGLESGLYTKNITHSPIKGPNGNIEYLIHFYKRGKTAAFNIKDVVKEAHVL